MKARARLPNPSSAAQEGAAIGPCVGGEGCAFTIDAGLPVGPGQAFDCFSCAGLESVSDPRFRLDVFRHGWVGFDLLPKLPHKYADGVRLLGANPAPNARKNFFVRHNFPGVLQQEFQQFKLLRREPDFLAAHFHVVGNRIGSASVTY
jgi:hypothetical protein